MNHNPANPFILYILIRPCSSFFHPGPLFIKQIRVQTIKVIKRIKVQAYSERSEVTGFARAALRVW